jgi:hypothetical protein
MPYDYEYSRPTVGGPGCSYANLCSYNSAYTRGVVPPVPSSAAGPMQYLIPSYGLPGYQTLTHGLGPSCSGYFSINQAYGQPGSGCARYTTGLCSGYCGGTANADRNVMAQMWN